jgi:hypothetical protein
VSALTVKAQRAPVIPEPEPDEDHLEAKHAHERAGLSEYTTWLGSQERIGAHEGDEGAEGDGEARDLRRDNVDWA